MSDYGIAEWGDFEYGSGGIPPVRFPLAFLAWKKLGRPEWPDPLGVYGIYQRRKMKSGKGYIKMKFYTPTNPQTVPQQANRAKFADAMSTWTSLTPEEKQPYIERAKRRQMKPWGLFVREYYQSH
jgi:hypothetical protein